jgi:hypothetical protein
MCVASLGRFVWPKAGKSGVWLLGLAREEQ